MSGREAERLAILADLKAHLPPGAGAVSWPNFSFATPKNENWIAVRINEFGTYRQSLGSKNFLKRYQGSLQIDVYIVNGVGTAQGKVITDWLEERYDSLVLLMPGQESIQFKTPYSQDVSGVQERQDSTNENWYRRVFDAPYYHDTVVVK